MSLRSLFDLIHHYAKSLFFTAIASLSMSIVAVHACTGIKLLPKDGSIIHGRTLEFGVEVDTAVAVVPRRFEFSGTTPNGAGLKYQARYGAVGITAFGVNALMDGLNEKGLAVGTFYFPGFAEYAKLSAENSTRALSAVEFPNWILTQFATIEEVKANISQAVIVQTIVKEWGTTPPPFHYIVYDRVGKCLVIEPTDGKLLVYDNPLGTFTNSPDFEWHMTNLRNFINLTPVNAKPLQIEGMTFAPFGQGSGLVGLPGDFTPPSRFVRAAIFSITAIPSANAAKGVEQAFHLLNQFDIPVGAAREKINGITYTDDTLLTCVRDPQSLKYYLKTYEDQSIKVVDLNSFDLNAKTIKSKKTSGKQTYVNISEELEEIK